ncbi:MAG: hypothetical protein LC795_15665 [Acidobacteria bacterium]|nr:hypothetical protein [Acidobacteriota bacterium]MCA1620713.1 hypothetical protein [Acidobacteriota bacterium]
MPSDYAAFELLIDNDDGTYTPVPSTTVKVYNVTGSAALADTASDAGGTVPGATVAVAVGTTLRFSVQLANGLAGCAEQITV